MSDWWDTWKKTLAGIVVAILIGLGTWLSNQGNTITQTTNGGTANAHTGTGDIIAGDKIINEYDEEKLINFAHEFAKKNREQDAERIKELERTVIVLSQQNKDKYNIDEALYLLSKGKPEKAEKIFELIALEAKEQGQEANLKEADALRHIGSLAFLHNTSKALDAYKRSTELDRPGVVPLSPFTPARREQLRTSLPRTNADTNASASTIANSSGVRFSFV